MGGVFRCYRSGTSIVMQPTAKPDYQSPAKRKLIPWHDELRFTLLGTVVGILTAMLVLIVVFNNVGNGSPIRYLCPVTYQLLMRYFPFPPTMVILLVVGSVFE